MHGRPEGHAILATKMRPQAVKQFSKTLPCTCFVLELGPVHPSQCLGLKCKCSKLRIEASVGKLHTDSWLIASRCIKHPASLNVLPTCLRNAPLKKMNSKLDVTTGQLKRQGQACHSGNHKGATSSKLNQLCNPARFQGSSSDPVFGKENEAPIPNL